MAINTENITTDITLELDEEEISIKEFRSAFDNFTGLVNEIAHIHHNNISNSDWLVKIYQGSAGVGLAPRNGLLQNSEKEKIFSLIYDGLVDLAKGIRPHVFSDKALDYSKKLACSFGNKKESANIRLWFGKKNNIKITQEIASNASIFIDTAYEEEGVIDGVLEKLEAHKGLAFVVYDVIDDHGIKCDVKEELLEKAVGYFRRRVEVQGRVKFRKDGHPISVSAKNIIPFPTDDKIPSLEDMRKILRGDE